MMSGDATELGDTSDRARAIMIQGSMQSLESMQVWAVFW